jgi:signal transduction histidine kinase
LLLTYLAVFAATFVLAAVAVRFAFVSDLDRQAGTRLELLARAGLRSVLFEDRGLQVDKREISRTALLARDQGLQWFDTRNRLLASEGLTPGAALGATRGRQPLRSEGRGYDTLALGIVDPADGAIVGAVRSSELSDRRLGEIRWLDTGLAVGTLLALLGSGAGGLVLTRRAVRPVAHSFQTLREFTADASHELRSPLTAIASNADAALRDVERNPLRDHARFEAIADGAQQMSRLTGDLLLLAGAERSLERDLFVVDLAALLARLESRYAGRFAGAGITLRTRGRESEIVYGNPEQIERIFVNLLDNALRYTPPGGSVTVETAPDRVGLRVAVRDTGIGIAPEHLERVFDRFWRADAARPHDGSGLGLAIARALARRHGGEVTVSSRLGEGTEFVVSLPTRPPRSE